MADETDKTEPTQTDIFKQQEKTIDLLYDVLQSKTISQPQTVYAAPAPAAKPQTNYVLYIGLGLLAYLALRK